MILEIAALIARQSKFKGELTRFSTFKKKKFENTDVNQIILRKDMRDYKLV